MDYGLLGGLGQGLSSFTSAYSEAKGRAAKKKESDEDRALKNKMFQMQLQQGGYVEEPNGIIDKTPEQKKSDALKQAESQAGLLKAGYQPEYDDASSSYKLNKISGYKDTEDRLKEAQINYYNSRGDVLGQNVGIKKDNQTSHAADLIHNNKQVLQLTQQLDRLDRGRSILDQPTITNQEFNDYQQEIQSAITNASGGGSLGKLQRTEYKTAQGALAGIKQQITGNPQDAVPRPIVERLKALADHTKSVMQAHRYDQAKNLKRNFSSNPDANTEQDKAIEIYNPSGSQSLAPSEAGLMNRPSGSGLVQPRGPGISPQDRAQLEGVLKANPNDPRAPHIRALLGGP